MSNIDPKSKIYAILADSVYWDVREGGTKSDEQKTSNWTPVPSDWKLIAEMSGSGDVGRALNKDLEGFTARAYQNGNKIVIAYAGTHQPDFSGDWKNNAKLGAGIASEQAKLAAIFYQQIKQSNALADIEFTGHSLGGGLAGMMGVWFNRPAYIFDHALFINTVIKEGDTKPSYREEPTFGDWIWDSLPEAVRSILSDEPEQLITSSTMKYARQALMEKFGYIDNEFARYSVEDHLEQRTKNITAIAVKGEFLDFVSFAGMHYKENDRILYGETTLGKGGKHSQTLLVSALLDEEGFGKYATNIDNNGANINTLSLIFDKELYGYEQNSDKQNFLTKLVRSHIGTTLGGGIDYATGDVNKEGAQVKYTGKSLLTGFGQDLGKLAKELKSYKGEYSPVWYDAMIAQSVEWYYHQNTNYDGKNFFAIQDGVIQYTTAKGDDLDITEIKSKEYTDKLHFAMIYPTIINHGINSTYYDLNNYKQWNFVLGKSSLSALDMEKSQFLFTIGESAKTTFISGNQEDFLFGGSDDDEIKGEGGDDKLYGSDGSDILYGGSGKDKLYGGHGEDTLYGDEDNDEIYGGSGIDTIYGGDGNDVLIGGINKDNIKDSDSQNELYGGAGDDTLKGSGRLEGGVGYDKYYAVDTATVKDEDGKGVLYYDNQRLIGANMMHYSESLTPPPELDFLHYGYDINDKSTSRLKEIESGENYVRYIVEGDNNFVYNNKLTTEDLESGDLGIKFYVTVYRKELPPPPPPSSPTLPPPFSPPKNPPVLSDPLVLDLNHNGQIDTLHLKQGVYFDLDGNNFAEQTSWVSGEDGFVVLDLNGNGKIDNGAELFGTDTILQGTGQKAEDGFIALAQYDKNQDNKINQEDDIYTRLKIWQDKNQDGISQTDELKTLEEHRITAIGVEKQNYHITDSNDVRHTYRGQFNQLVENKQGQEALQQGYAETLLFQVNSAHTKWQGQQDDTGIHQDIKKLPDLMGYGIVKSLHQTMADDQTGVLKQLVERFVISSKDEEHALVEQIISRWTNSHHIDSVLAEDSHVKINKQQFEVLKNLWGKHEEWKDANLNRFAQGSLESAYQEVIHRVHSQLLSQSKYKSWFDWIEFSITQDEGEKFYHADFSLLLENIATLYQHNSGYTRQVVQELNFIIKYLDVNHDIIYNDWLIQLDFTIKRYHLTDLDNFLLQEEENPLSHRIVKEISDYHRASDTDNIIYSSSVEQKYFYGGKGNDSYIFSLGGGEDIIYEYDNLQAKLDRILFTEEIKPEHLLLKRVNDDLVIHYSLQDNVRVGNFFNQGDGLGSGHIEQIKFADGTIWTEKDMIVKTMQSTSDNDMLYGYNHQNDIIHGLDGDDILYGYGGDDILNGNIGNDKLYGGEGNDHLYGEQGNDHLYGEDGNDILNGDAGNDQLYGGDGDDSLNAGVGDDYLDAGDGDDSLNAGVGDDYLDAGDGDDILTGGTGNDTLVGGQGNNKYLFSLGDGEDIFYRNYSNQNSLDLLLFTEEIKLEHVTLKRVDYNLVIQYSKQDNITLSNFFDESGVSLGNIIKIQFSDGRVWTTEDILAKVESATSGNDILYGYNKNDILNGLDGNDILYGYSGDDLLSGNAGHDQLFGYDGNDVLDGGDGDDKLDGGQGEDTYVFTQNWGIDTIHDAIEGNRIQFIGIQPDSLKLYQRHDTLFIQQIGTDNLIKVEGQFKHNTQQNSSEQIIQFIHFDNGIVWNKHDILHKVLNGGHTDDTLYGFTQDNQMSGGLGHDILHGSIGQDYLHGGEDDDQLYGYYGNDRLEGGKGNDRLEGGNGNDRLEGGDGNDHLEGGHGDDIYHFQPDWGQDVIRDDTGQNQIYFHQLSASSLVLSRKEHDLIIKQSDSEHTITVINHFRVDAQPVITAIHFDDGTHWTVEDIRKQTMIGTAHDDVIHGLASNDQLFGLQGADQLFGGEGHDTLYGGDGNDTLHGEQGNDHLIGGLGSDILEGGAGTDRLEGGAGDDTYIIHDIHDTIIEKHDEGIDHVISHIDLTLAEHIEHLTLADTSYLTVARTAIGNRLNNTLTGNYLDNVLDGKDGADILIGGLGNDTYYVEHSEDVIREHLYEGLDTVFASVDYILPEHVENLYLTEEALSAIGNDLNNELRGNAQNNRLLGGLGNDILDGGFGADILVGGQGDDTYYVDNQKDSVNESLNQGVDSVFSRIDYILPEHVEYLYLQEHAISGIGNALDNTIVGNAENNILDGKQGADRLMGGLGNDYYVLDHEQDEIVEHAGEGIDSVEQWVDRPFYRTDDTGQRIKTTSYQMLQNHVENLILKGTATTVFGNDLDNHITLNEQNNFVNALTGNDVIVYQKGGGHDRISSKDDISAKDTLLIQGYDASQATFVRMSNSATGHDMLQIRFKGNPSDQITLIDYFAPTTNGQDYRIDEIRFVHNNQSTVLSQAQWESQVISQALNHAPTVNKHPKAITANVGKTLSVTFDADTIKDVDAYDSSLSYRMTLATRNAQGQYEALPSWLSFDAKTLTLTTTPTHTHLGQYQLILWGTDHFGLSAGTYVNINVQKAVESSQPSTPQNPTTPVVVDSSTNTNKVIKLQQKNNLLGKTSHDTLSGTEHHDRLQGFAGNDTLHGKAGNDVLIGGVGQDTLIGGAGNDLYYFSKGFGRDAIVNTGGGIDNVYFEGITTQQVKSGFGKVNNDLTLKVSGTTDQLTVKNFFLGGEYANLQFNFADNLHFSSQSILQAFKSKSTPSHSQSSDYYQALQHSLALKQGFEQFDKDKYLVEVNVPII